MRRWRWALLGMTLALVGCEPGQVTVRVNSPQDVRLDAAAVVPAGSDEVATALLKALCGEPWQVFPRTRGDLVSIEAHRHFGTRDYPAVKVEQKVVGPLGLRRETRLSWPNPLAKLPKDDWRRAILTSLKGELKLRVELPGRITKDSAAGATRDGGAAVWTLSLADLGAKGESGEFSVVSRSVRWGLLAGYLAVLALIGWIVQPALTRSPEQRAAAAARREQRATARAARRATAAERKAAVTGEPAASPAPARPSRFGRRTSAAVPPAVVDDDPPVSLPALAPAPDSQAPPATAAESPVAAEPEVEAAQPEPAAELPSEIMPEADAAPAEALPAVAEPTAAVKTRRRGCLGFLRRRPRTPAPTSPADEPAAEPTPPRRRLFGRRPSAGVSLRSAPATPDSAPGEEPAGALPAATADAVVGSAAADQGPATPAGPAAVRRRRQGYGSMPRRR
ncbi:MAG: hypothetical protein IT204_20575 [Fimbriimonadaceae bacterium]|nr:hypothetical protein [Fimbriimonadaceae bacterium]